ncbi:hypothetical protein ACMA46_00575 [Clavibacter sp. Sh2141]|uniref:hypothetical protein n=1 Tax=Clavibacter sp. Sh2141 TaxID=3395374 RepID=UPI0039BD727D
MTVPTGAALLLISSHPDLTPEQRHQVLALIAIDSGEPLNERTEGSWHRLDLPAAKATKVVVTADGTISVVKPGKRRPDPEPHTEEGRVADGRRPSKHALSSFEELPAQEVA